MEVNHDLIAAGHPRLTFEFSAFYDLIHKHWHHEYEVTKYPSRHGNATFDADAWQIGQLVAAEASLKLLAHRADSGVWPEFAEHSCTACHHDLKGESDRQKRGYDGRRPGVMPQNPWYSALLSDAVGTADKTQQAKANEALVALIKEMQERRPDAKAAKQHAQKLAAVIQERLASISIPGGADAALQQVSGRGLPKSVDDDDHAVQIILARAALARTGVGKQAPLPRPTAQLLLQIPTNPNVATINPAAYRKVLDDFRKKEPR
jgi:hypothetical protein